MTRKKVKLAFIENDASRKATYKKRKKGLLKKVDEITTLCGIEACAIIYSSYDPQPDIWPSPWGVQKVLSKYRTMPELEQSKKKMNQESFMKQRVLKAKEQVKKQRKDNREKEMALLMFQCLNAGKIVNNMSMVDMNDLAWLIDQNLKDIGRKLEAGDYNNNNDQNQIMMGTQSEIMNIPNQIQMEPPPTTKHEEMELMMGHGHGHVGLGMNNGEIMRKHLFMDMMMNVNAEESIPFGHVNLQNGFWPNLLP